MKEVVDVIRRPIISEKSTMIAEKDCSQYVFEVDKRANKQEIKEAVTRLFGVKVLNVNTMVMPGKDRRFGRYIGRQNKWKRAVVTLAAGESIEFETPDESVVA